MKKIQHILFSTIALLAFVPIARAQQDSTYYRDNGNGVSYYKAISEPNTQGVYTITLGSFVEGEVTVKMQSAPVDIVLILDYSTSMNQSDYFTRTGNYAAVNSANYDQVSSTTNGTNYYIKKGDDYYQLKVNRTGNWGSYRYQFYYIDSEGTLTTVQGPNSSNTFNSSTTYPLYSASGTYGTRISALKKAVGNFITAIHENDIKDDDGVARDYPLGNRIYPIIFNSSAIIPGTNLTDDGWMDVTINGGENTNIFSWINGRNTGDYTNSDLAMQEAISGLNKITPERRDTSSRVVVFFTDGSPGYTNSWATGTGANSSGRRADDCIGYAYQIKHRADTTKIFSIGLIGNLAPDVYQRASDYLNYTSSNYPDAEGWYEAGSTTWNSTIGEKISSEYRKEAGDKLDDVFGEIAKQSGGSGNTDMSSAVTAVDVVSASFMIPRNEGETDLQLKNKIKVFLAPCIGYVQPDSTYTIRVNGKDVVKHYLAFGNLIPAADSITVGLQAAPGSQHLNQISVNGFDYSANWCGPDDTSDSGFHGYKLVVKIPIKMDTLAVGGPNIETNGPGSGIYTVIDGERVPVVEFKSPTVSLPVNIHINKIGLQEGESAKFIIERALLPEVEEGETIDYDNLGWGPVTSVFVTRHDGENAQEPITKIKGLPSTILVEGQQKPVIYRVVEDEDWSWSYHSRVIGYDNTHQLVTNPFKFQNILKDDINTKIRHAESKATNTFNPDVQNVKYDDSKPNTGKGR